MKRFGVLYILLFSFCSMIGAQTGIKHKPIVRPEAAQAAQRLQDKLNRKLQLKWDENFRTPVFIGGKLTQPGYAVSSDVKSAGIKFVTENKELFGLKSPAEELRAVSVEKDELSMSHIKYQQVYKGIKVYKGELIVHLAADGAVESVNGRHYTTPDIAVTPSLDENSAISMVKSKYGAAKTDKESAELVVYENKGKMVLAYEVRLSFGMTPNFRSYVDASTGEIIKTDRGIRYDGPSVGSGTGSDGVSRSLHTYLAGGDYYLIDAALPMYRAPVDSFNGVIATYNAKNDTTGTGYESAKVIFDPNRNNNFNDNISLRAAVDVHIAAREVYGFYQKYFKRNSFSGTGSSIINVVHYMSKYNNAFWNGNCLTFGDGDGVRFGDFTRSLDIIAHEFTHAVTSYTADLIYENQSGALNESMSDVFASLADSTNWLIGENSFTPGISGDALRNMADPHNGKSTGDLNGGWLPAHMSEFVKMANDEDNDYGGVHINCGITNKAFYNVATAIGRWKAGQIWYRSLTRYLTMNSQFIDLRTACMISAADLFGSGSAEYNAVVTGFDGVGITDSPSGGDAVDLVYDDDSPASGVYEETAKWALAAKFTSPSKNVVLTGISLFIGGDNVNGTGHSGIMVMTENQSTQLPANTILGPYSYTPAWTGWQVFEVSNVAISGNFFVGIQYDGVNQPLLGADLPPGNGRAYEYSPVSGTWYKLDSPNDYTLFIRASVKTVTAVVEMDSRVPAEFSLEQNYPNPFNPSTSIKYSLPKGEQVSLEVFDINGRRVAELVNNYQNAGMYEVSWNGLDDNGRNVSSGIYFCTIKAGSFMKSQKMVLLK